MRAAAAGCAYFALVFLVGALLGPLRIFVATPWVGPVAAVLIELPLLLAASWLICTRLASHCAVPTAARSRLVMGGVAFALLMVAEFALTIFVLGGTAASHFARYRAPDALLGLAGQLAFALMPLATRRSSRTAP